MCVDLHNKDTCGVKGVKELEFVYQGVCNFFYRKKRGALPPHGAMSANGGGGILQSPSLFAKICAF